ncbi:MAG: superfamily II DNA/RNA helicase [Halioglobus sp.]
MFSQLQLDRRLVLALESLDFTQATAVQEKMVPAVLTGADLSVSAETGSGKTLAYLLPILHQLLSQKLEDDTATLVLILVPTRELARQVLKQCRELTGKCPLSVQAITGGADFKFQRSIFNKNPEIVVGTPGRILEHCEKGSADFSGMKTLVLDEADRMLDMGFREDVLKINEYCALEKQVLMLSATLQHRALEGVAASMMKDAEIIDIGRVRDAHSSIFHQMILADNADHKDKVLAALLAHGGFERALIFSNKRATAQRLAGLMSYHKFRCGSLHGQMSTEERRHVITQFKDGKIDIVSASDLAARGLDVKDVSLVINYDIPRNGDDYLHRTGRTGRAGAQGLAVSLVGSTEWNLLAGIERYLNLSIERRALPGLKAKFTGPKKVKSSGKAAGTKKKKRITASTDKSKSRKRNQKNQGKPKSSGNSVANDGFAPLIKKKTSPPLQD